MSKINRNSQINKLAYYQNTSKIQPDNYITSEQTKGAEQKNVNLFQIKKTQ